MILELSENFANIALILSNSYRFWVNSNFFVRLFHPPQFIMIPPIYDFSKIFQPLPNIKPSYYYTVGRLRQKFTALETF